MKRITAIELHNFLAFYGSDNKISLPKGQNLLLYGENGSGKSSLCRALEVFFEAKSAPDFDKNFRNIWADGADAATSIKVDFIDESVSPLPETIELPTRVSRQWVEESRLASGFLTYRDMLKTHFLEEHRRNLFDLVVNEILRGFKNSKSGKLLSSEWEEIDKGIEIFLSKGKEDFERIEYDESGEPMSLNDIIEDSINDFRIQSKAFDDAFDVALQQFNPKVNEFLAFFEQNIIVELVIGDRLDRFGNPVKGTMIPPYPNLNDIIDLLKELHDKAIDSDTQKGAKILLQSLILKKPILSAEVKYFEQFIPEHYSFLNEARLSALAICIFLAALKLKPDPPDGCKVLFLDDVLIGLDSGNRLPLLRILETHFQDFQVMISTYDRHWFEASKRFTSGSGGWKHAELFAKEEISATRRFIRPVLHESESNMARALYYFKNSYRPDYPAAVNYLRKSLEELIRENLPPKELKEQTGETQDSSRLLKPLLAKTKAFFERIHQPTITVDHIREKLRTLLNPLSHFETDTPIYRNEVQEIFQLAEQLEKQFKIIKPNLKEVLPQDSWVQIQFTISPTETGYFRLKIRETLYFSNSAFSNCTFWTAITHTVLNGTESSKITLSKQIVESYTGLKDAYDKILTFCQSGSYPTLTANSDYLNAIFIEENGIAIPIKSKI